MKKSKPFTLSLKFFVFVLILIIVSSCEMFIEEILSEAYQEPSPRPISIFDHNSYFPIIEGYQWTYDDGIVIEVRNVNESAGTFEFVVVNTNSVSEGSLGRDKAGTFIQGLSEYLPFDPVIYEDETLELGFSWSDGQEIIHDLEITSMQKDITTPGSQQYTDCLELTRTVSYPDDYEQDPRIESEIYHFKRGIGIVQITTQWSDSSSDTHYVVDHSQLYTVTYDSNGANSGSVPVDDGAYLSGNHTEVLNNSGKLRKTGSIFSGWNTQADGNGITYNPHDEFIIPDHQTTLFALWEEFTGEVGSRGPAGGYIIYDDQVGFDRDFDGHISSYEKDLLDGIQDGVVTENRFLEAAPSGWYDGTYDSEGIYTGEGDPRFEWGAWGYQVIPENTWEEHIGYREYDAGELLTEIIVNYHDNLGMTEGYPGYVEGWGSFYDNPSAYRIGNNNDGTVAAKICDDAVINGFEDWFLPTEDVFILMYHCLYLQGIGNIHLDEYWASDWHGAFVDLSRIDLYYSGSSSRDTNSHIFIRPVRAF
jgi:hypothetical protein